MEIKELPLRTLLLFQAALDRFQSGRPLGRFLNGQRRNLELTALEERVFLSASPMGALAPESVDVAVPPESPGGAEAETTQAAQSGEIDPVLAALEVETAPASEARELVFIDANVRDADVLLADLGLSEDAGRYFEVIQLSAERDGVEQISEVLANHHNLDAVHIVSHGRDGALRLGSDWLDEQQLEWHSEAISQWGLAFASDGDLLLYGCDLAATEQGQEFLASLTLLTGADVAASGDATGASSLGGDWDLEYQTGSVGSELAFSAAAQQEYADVLAIHDADEFRVNTTTTDTQATDWSSRGSHQAVALDANGNSVVVWSSLNQDGDGWGVYAQRFDNAGSPVGGEILVNQSTTGVQQFAAVAMTDSGEFVVSWYDAQAGDVHARLFAADGTPQSGELLINTTVSGTQTKPSIAVDSAGNFVVVWEGNGSGDSSGVFGRRFDSAGNPLGTEFRVNSSTLGTQSDAAVAMNASGQFVVTWDDGTNFYAQQYNSDGTANGGQILIQTALLATNGDGAVAIADDGSFVATWNEDVLLFGEEVYVRRYDANGNSLGASEVVNTTTSGTQRNPSISMDDQGNYIIVWEGSGTGDSSGVFAQRYDSSGNAVGGEVRINQSTSGTQHFASVAMDDLNNYIAVWSGSGAGDTDGVYARQIGTAVDNAAPTALTLTNSSLSENTDTTSGKTIGQLTATDPDAGETFTFVIHGGTDAALFSIGGGNADELLLTDGTLDFERQSSYEVIVGVTDSAGNFFAETFTISVTNQNEQPTATNATFSVAEHSENGTSVGFVSATDPDAGDSLTYSIASGNPGGSFSINASTGEISIANGTVVDFETMPTITLTIEVRDSGLLADMATVTINLTDQNETPSVDPLTFSVNENANPGTIGPITVGDPDAGDTYTLQIVGGNDQGLFALDENSGNFRLTTTGPLDYETATQHTLQLQVTDAGGLQSVGTVVVNVNDLNDAPILADTSFDVQHSAPNGTLAGALSAVDPDAGETLTYVILSGNTGGLFSLDSTTGELRVAHSSSLDATAFSTVVLEVRVTDSQGLSDTANISVNVVDSDAQPVVPNANFSVTEHAAAGTVVGTVTATDPNGNTPLTFAFLRGNNGGVFEIDAQTGEIRVAKPSAVNFEARTQFDLVVEVTNSIGVRQVANVTIAVINVNEPPIAVDDAFLSHGSLIHFDHEDFTRNDLNPEGEKLRVIGFSDLGQAQIIDNGDQTFLFLAPEGLTQGELAFTYTIEDESGRTSSATMTVVFNIAPQSIVGPDSPLLQEVRSPGTSPQLAPPPQPGQPGPSSDNASRAAQPEHVEADPESEENPAPIRGVPAEDGGLTPLLVSSFDPEVRGLPQESPEESPERDSSIQVEFPAALGATTANASPGLAEYHERIAHAVLGEEFSVPRDVFFAGHTQHAESQHVVVPAIGEASRLWQDLDQVEEDMHAEVDLQSIVVGAAVTVSSTFTVGYVLWMIRGGVLMGSLLAQMPAWRLIDPLPILEYMKDLDEMEDQESLENIIEAATVA